MALPELVQCRTCGTRALPATAAREWEPHGGRCELCRMAPAERLRIERAADRAAEHFRELDRQRERE
jgi:hypothetical protein